MNASTPIDSGPGTVGLPQQAFTALATDVTKAVALLGLLAYGLMRHSYDQFYKSFGLSLEDLGISYEQVLSQAAVWLMSMFILLAPLIPVFALAITIGAFPYIVLTAPLWLPVRWAWRRSRSRFHDLRPFTIPSLSVLFSVILIAAALTLAPPGPRVGDSEAFAKLAGAALALVAVIQVLLYLWHEWGAAWVLRLRRSRTPRELRLQAICGASALSALVFMSLLTPEVAQRASREVRQGVAAQTLFGLRSPYASVYSTTAAGMRAPTTVAGHCLMYLGLSNSHFFSSTRRPCRRSDCLRAT